MQLQRTITPQHDLVHRYEVQLRSYTRTAARETTAVINPPEEGMCPARRKTTRRMQHPWATQVTGAVTWPWQGCEPQLATCNPSVLGGVGTEYVGRGVSSSNFYQRARRLVAVTIAMWCKRGRGEWGEGIQGVSKRVREGESPQAPPAETPNDA